MTGDSPRILLSSVFKPFTVPSAYNAPNNLIDHALFHRSFTRRQGMFTILEQQPTYPLHLIAHNLSARTTVLDYPSLEAFAREVDRGYDIVAIGCVASTLNKARRMCELVKERAPQARTVVGGPGAMAVGEHAEPFSDELCRGDGVRFMQRLIGDPPARIRFPIRRTFHGASSVLGLPMQGCSFPVAVGLGCPRQCEFCSTSRQFEGRYTPMFDSGAELFGFMKQVEQHERARGRLHSHLNFLIYDENFLTNRPFVEQFRALNRRQLLSGPQYQCFVFSDATVVSQYSVEELLEIGIDTIWIGVESPALAGLEKLEGVDPRGLMAELSAAGIKVFGSLIAGFEEHTEALIRQDIEYALTLDTIGVQYMPVNPIPGTVYHDKLKRRGLLADRDLRYFSMSHYNVKHPTLDEAAVLGLIREYYDREHDENGPLVLRFLDARWRGYLQLRQSPNPYVRARTRIYASDLLRGYPVLLLGETLGPSARVRGAFGALRREVEQHFGWTPVLADLLAGRRAASEGGPYLAMSLPGLRGLARKLLETNTLRSDPRAGGLLELLSGRRAALERCRRGTLPWGQPETLRTEYGRGQTSIG